MTNGQKAGVTSSLKVLEGILAWDTGDSNQELYKRLRRIKKNLQIVLKLSVLAILVSVGYSKDYGYYWYAYDTDSSFFASTGHFKDASSAMNSWSRYVECFGIKDWSLEDAQ